MSVTWKLKTGVKWSDGEDFTADDVKFTFDYVSNKDTAATSFASYATVSAVDVDDPNHGESDLQGPDSRLVQPLCGSYGGIVPQHILRYSVGRRPVSTLQPQADWHRSLIVDDFKARRPDPQLDQRRLPRGG